MNRELERKRQIERWIAWIRLLAIPFAFVEVGVLSHGYPPGHERWAWIATCALVAGGAGIWLLATRDLSPRRQTLLAFGALAFGCAGASSHLHVRLRRGGPRRARP